ncbi:L,D-transpeptidase family protein [Ferruginibacter sp. SUN002]|uniref:L,D-transpeptidase family protein n=1 Tax=Ferruginibacter sp. SUN002 TaxID=2937789 RepID=UPI003D36CC7C
MKNLFVGACLLALLAITAGNSAFGQTAFTDYKTSSYKLAEIYNRKEDSLKKQFEAKKLSWPVKEMYIRSFKYDRQLEVWVKSSDSGSYKLFKTYRVCMQSGTMGPKRMEGDYQIPEGFYYINDFNPNSNYHLSLGLNYPNASDRILADDAHPGSNIYIHGSCVSVGCLAISDEPIEELYILANQAKEAGQDFIPVHIFPVRYDLKKSMDYLTQFTKTNHALEDFSNSLKVAFDHFEAKRALPVVMVNKQGKYIVE